jgi:hypothetical protein
MIAWIVPMQPMQHRDPSEIRNSPEQAEVNRSGFHRSFR